jgi:cysteine-rich repeat protein
MSALRSAPALARAPTRSILLALVLAGCFTGKDQDESADELGDTTDAGTDTSTSESTQDESTQSETSDEDTTTGPCTQAGCECNDSEGSCDPGLACIEGSCTMPVCGNSIVEAGEQCDDGNRDDGEGCDADCTYTEILYVDPSYQNT